MAMSQRELQAKLTPKQQKAALMMVESQLSSELDLKDRTKEQISSELGISRMTLYRWTQNRIFIDYMNTIADDMLASYHSEMMKVVIDTAVKHKSMKAVELYAKLRGLLKDHQIVETAELKERTSEQINKEIDELEKLLNDEVGDDSISEEELI